MMNEHEQVDRMCDDTAEYVFEAFYEGANEDELRWYHKRRDGGEAAA